MNTEPIQEIASLIYNDLLDDLSDEEVLDLLLKMLDVKNRLDLMSQLGFNMESSFLAFLKDTRTAGDLIKFIDTSQPALSTELLRAIGVNFLDVEDLPDNDNLWKVKAKFDGKQYTRHADSPDDAIRELAREVIKDIFQ